MVRVIFPSVVLAKQLSGTHLRHRKLLPCPYPEGFQLFVECCLQLVLSIHSWHILYNAWWGRRIPLHTNTDIITRRFLGLARVFSRNTVCTVLRLPEHSPFARPFIKFTFAFSCQNSRLKWRCVRKSIIFINVLLAVTVCFLSMHCMMQISCLNTFYHS